MGRLSGVSRSLEGVVDDGAKESNEKNAGVALLEFSKEANVVNLSLDEKVLKDEVLSVATITLSGELGVGKPDAGPRDAGVADTMLSTVDEETKFDHYVVSISLAPLTALYTGAPTLDFM